MISYGKEFVIKRHFREGKMAFINVKAKIFLYTALACLIATSAFAFVGRKAVQMCSETSELCCSWCATFFLEARNAKVARGIPLVFPAEGQR